LPFGNGFGQQIFDPILQTLPDLTNLMPKMCTHLFWFGMSHLGERDA
jgi:hypothetical protein